MNKDNKNFSLKQGNLFNKSSYLKSMQKGSIFEKFTTSIPINIQPKTLNEKKEKLFNLENHLNILKTDYENIIKKIYDDSKLYLDRIDPSNIYLNKFIQFSSGELFYVTSMGVAKFVPDLDSLTNTGVSFNPDDVIIINDADVPKNFTIYGNEIKTSPPLITGTPVVPNKLITDANINVYSDKMISNDNSNYEGCFSNNPTPMSVPEINRMTYDDCKRMAIKKGYKYYGLKNTNFSNLLGTCSLSNNDLVLDNDVATDCQLEGENNYGGLNSIAAYKMDEVGNMNNYEKYGYIDSNAILHKFPNNVFKPLSGLPEEVNNIDTIKFGNYKLGSILGNKKYGNYISKKDQKRLNYLNDEINKVARQINDISIELRLNNQWINNKINKNYRLASGALDLINDSASEINEKIDKVPKYKYMEEDSDINIIQKNYTFILFSVLVISSLVISINLMNK